MNFHTITEAILRTIKSCGEPIGRFFEYTKLQEQIKEVDVNGLFSNPWFLVPCIALVSYQLYKMAFRELIIMGLIFAVWWASGTPYMHSLVVNGELQFTKVLPVLFGGAAILGFIIYLLFGRSD